MTPEAIEEIRRLAAAGEEGATYPKLSRALSRLMIDQLVEINASGTLYTQYPRYRLTRRGRERAQHLGILEEEDMPRPKKMPSATEIMSTQDEQLRVTLAQLEQVRKENLNLVNRIATLQQGVIDAETRLLIEAQTARAGKQATQLQEMQLHNENMQATIEEMEREIEALREERDALRDERDTLRRKVSELIALVAKRKRTDAQRLADAIKLITDVSGSEWMTHAQRNGIDLLVKKLAARLENELDGEEGAPAEPPPSGRVFTPPF